MKHEHIGFLSRTKQWQMLTEPLSTFDDDPQTVTVFANQILQDIKNETVSSFV